MNRKEIERLTQELADGSLSQEEAQALQAELAQNAEARQRFRHSMQVEIMLMEEMDVMASHAPSNAGHLQPHHPHHATRRMRAPLLAIAAVLVLLAAIFFLLQPPTSEGSWQCVAVPGTLWEITQSDGSSSDRDQSLTQGDTLIVEAGSILLHDDSGCRLLVQGPAKVSFPKIDHAILQEGWFWYDGGGSKRSIQVDAGHHQYRNIGTRFGLRVHSNKSSEIHLIQGLVEVSDQTENSPLSISPSSSGLLFSEHGQPDELPLANDPFPILNVLLESKADYRTTILSQSPTAYWKLDEMARGKMANELDPAAPATSTSETAAGHTSMTPEDGYTGFGELNRSVFMTGHPLRSLITDIHPQQGLKKKEGAMSLWIKPSASTQRNEILWLAGEGSKGQSRNPERSLMHIQLSRAGGANFFLENDGRDILLSSKPVVDADHWHHLAISWSMDSAELYVDGKLAARSDGLRTPQSGIFNSKRLRFGKPSHDLAEQGNNPYIGWIDEIAVWDRPLSEAEVAQQHASATK